MKRISGIAFGRAWASALAAGLVAWGNLTSAADRDVVINEIMYHPPNDQDKLQFVEVFNRGSEAVNLSQWSFTKGIKFTFPKGTIAAPQSFLVLCLDPGAFSAHYGREVSPLGPFGGRLSHKSDRLELVNAAGEVIDSLKYGDGNGWPAGADGYSSSLERICPQAPSDAPANWAASTWPPAKRAAGTPGRMNSCLVTNLPPQISNVTFLPVAPTPLQSVKVTASIAAQDGVQSVQLLYRLPTTGRESDEQSIAMTRVSGDAKEGVYQATLPPRPNGQLVRFRIKATDGAGLDRLEPGVNEPRPTYSYFSYTNAIPAKIAVGQLVNVSRAPRGPGHYERKPSRRAQTAIPIRGNGAFLYVPADGSPPQTLDYVKVVGRHGGTKVHFQKDNTLKGMSAINLISEGPMRWILAEPLAYVVYRMAGVPCPLTEHIRISLDGRNVGLQLLVEQPNQSFLTRNSRDPSGDLYKLIWYGQGIVGQHEKKTNPETGHAALVRLIQDLKAKSGRDQWAYIQQHFNVDEVASYYAVNMCIQNWDGFFNNYYVYQDLNPNGKWEIFPWDEDKTWGDYDGASPRYDWYSMPLTFGMNGDASPREFLSFGGGPFGGVSWWRPPGYLSGPLLANPEFRRLFLARLQVLCQSAFTETNLNPIIQVMQQRLEPEVRAQASATGADAQQAVREFTGYMNSFRSQVVNRRKFILQELAKMR